jgi:TRAP-type C4-dicarboxylate transport system substrate-binding protein
MMKTGNLLECVLAGFVSVFLLVMSANAEEFTLRIGAGHPTPGLVYVYAADTYFVPEVERRVKERTGHSVRFVKAWAGTIAKPDSIIDAVQKGSLDIGLNAVGFDLGRLRLLNFGYYFPFSPDEMLSQQLSMKMLNEVSALQESVKPYNIRILFLAPTDEYGMITKFKIDRMADIAGKRIACAGANAPWVQAAGGVPVQLPISENYQGLQTGMIDGNVYAASGMTSFRLVEIAKYYTNTGFGAIVGGIGAYMNLDTRKKLPKDIVDIIDEVAVETSQDRGNQQAAQR